MEIPLTEANPQSAEYQRNVVPGMAFLKGSGPEGKTCRSCSAYLVTSYQPGSNGVAKNGRCEMYRKMMRGKAGPSIGPDNPCCKYYEQSKGEKNGA